MSDITIREATVNDIPQMLALWRCFWAPQKYEANLRRKIETDAELVLVAETDNEIVGTVIGGFDCWWAWVYRVAVHPAHQRRGVASNLLREIHSRLRARGADAACLIASAENENMCRLLKKLGYRERPDRRFSFVLDAT